MDVLFGRPVRLVLQVPLLLCGRDDMHADAVAVGEGAKRELVAPPAIEGDRWPSVSHL